MVMNIRTPRTRKSISVVQAQPGGHPQKAASAGPDSTAVPHCSPPRCPLTGTTSLLFIYPFHKGVQIRCPGLHTAGFPAYFHG